MKVKGDIARMRVGGDFLIAMIIGNEMMAGLGEGITNGDEVTEETIGTTSVE
jgi:hypothetical protein